MKIPIHSRTKPQEGSALLITSVILVVACAVLATYLLVSENEYTAVARSQTWNNAIVLTEAGVEDALGFMNKYEGDIGMVNQWSTPASAQQDGWTVNGNLYTMHRVVDSQMGYYDVTIDNTISNAPVISCTGTAYWNLGTASATPPFMLAAAGLSVSTGMTTARTVKMQATYSALFPGAITTKNVINLNGNNVRVDSFDSTMTNSSDWLSSLGYGTYDITKARNNGNVATDSSVIGAISVGQANIYGHLNTGPGGSATIGNNGYVGPLPQVGSGIQSGWTNDDMNVAFPNVALPSGASSWQPVPASGVITNSGNYYTTYIDNSMTINAPNVTIYVAGSVSLSSHEAITIGTNATSVTMYVAGPSFNISGNGVANQTQHASVLAIYGLPSLTGISFGGNAAFTGMIYAPQANFQFGGGGSSDNSDYTGSLVANSVQLNGHSNFHYDESLKRTGPGIGYIPTYWKEVVNNN